MTNKTNKTAAARAAKTDTANTVNLDWTAEIASIQQAAKEKTGSRGDQLGKVAAYMATESAGALLLREAASRQTGQFTGGQAIIALSRNVLAKLPKLAGAIASGQPYCSLDALETSRHGDASVPVALASLGAGDARQKAVVAQAAKRYPQGGNAQMPAALDALCFMGIVQRKDTGSTRNAEYAVIDEDRARALIPSA